MVGIFKMMERRIKFNPNYRASMFWLSHKKRNDEIDRYLAIKCPLQFIAITANKV
jgi:hypothetical protein